MYISHSKTGERSLLSSSSSVLSPNCPRVRRLPSFPVPSYLPLIHFLPSLPLSLFAVVVITFRGLKKVFVAGKEYALFRLPLSPRRGGWEKRKERERVRASGFSGVVGRVTQGFHLPICSPFDDIMIIIFIRWETSPHIADDCFSLCESGGCCDASLSLAMLLRSLKVEQKIFFRLSLSSFGRTFRLAIGI